MTIGNIIQRAKQLGPIPIDNIITRVLRTNPDAPEVPTSYRPPEWNLASYSFDYSVTDEGILLRDNIQGYFFDATIRAEHTSSLRMTEHPIQSGANIVDHAYMLPNSLVMEIGMSDVMDSFLPGQWPAAYKSVRAYEKLKELQKERLPLQVVTRFGIYQNMLIEQLNSIDESRVAYGGRFIVSMRQIITAQVRQAEVSILPQITEESNKGPVQPQSSVEKKRSALDAALDELGMPH